MTDVINRLIASIAFRQHGNITRWQLLDLGLSSSGITHRVKIGLLHPVFRGVYAVGSPPQTPVQRAAASVLASGLHGALAGGSAMSAWGFWRRWEEPFEVALLEGDRRTPGIRLHRPRNLTRRDVRIQLGIRVTSPARTMLDIAARRTDRQYKRDVNNALHSHILTAGAIVDLLVRNPHHPAAKRLSYFVTTDGGPTQSDWEREFPAFCLAQHLPPPVMALRRSGHTPDAALPGLGIVFELDSWEYHSTRLDFETDRDRDVDYMVDNLLPIRITWERMMHLPDREGERLRKIVALRERYLRAIAA